MSHLGMLNCRMVRVFINGLELTGHHGAAPEERQVGNRFVFDIDMSVDGNADKTDNLADTVDYGAVCHLVKAVSDGRQFATVEALAGAVAEAIIGRFPRALEVQVRCAKLLPPVPLPVRAAGAVVTRKQKA